MLCVGMRLCICKTSCIYILSLYEKFTASVNEMDRDRKIFERKKIWTMEHPNNTMINGA